MYLALEGVDDVGKTSILKRIKPHLNDFVNSYSLPRIQYISETEITPPNIFTSDEAKERYLAMKYAIQRIDMFSEIFPTNDIVISDRSVFSSYAYQGRYMAYHTLLDINKYCEHPDYVILIDSGDYTSTEYENNYTKMLAETETDYCILSKHDAGLAREVLHIIIKQIIKEYASGLSERWILNNIGVY